LLHTTLKRGKVSTADQLHLQMLDPFVSMMTKCLQAKHTKVHTLINIISRAQVLTLININSRAQVLTLINIISRAQVLTLINIISRAQVLTLALRCLCWIVKFPLPSLDKLVPQIAKLLFKLLKKYAMAGAKIGDNYEMVLSAFKLTILTTQYVIAYDLDNSSVESHLTYPHAWVRLVSCRLFGLLFAAWTPQELSIASTSGSKEFLAQESLEKVSQLCDDFCVQLDSPFLDNDLGDQVVKNLVFLAKVLHYNMSPETNGTKAGRGTGSGISLGTLISKMERLATHEASQTPKVTRK
ncbi:predicted protein, partial [Nematostella vectensis]